MLESLQNLQAQLLTLGRREAGIRGPLSPMATQVAAVQQPMNASILAARSAATELTSVQSTCTECGRRSLAAGTAEGPTGCVQSAEKRSDTKAVYGKVNPGPVAAPSLMHSVLHLPGCPPLVP